MNDLRLNDRDLPWPERPWLMAVLCALAGLLFYWLVDDGDATRGPASAASGVAVATIALVLTIERRRWTWAVGFSLGWGVVIALIAWMAAGYGRAQTVAEWPFFSGIFAVLLAAPLFQALRDHGTWRFPTASAHDHIWTDAVIGTASLAFVAISLLLAWLIASLFKLVGINFVENLLQSGWFGWMLAGTAFGGAIGLLRERDALVSTLHRLAMVVLSVLAPVLAVALVLFLLSLPFAGFDGLWDGWASAAALTLASGAGSLILANAALGPIGADKPVNAVFRYSALALSLAILPLAVLATLAMGLRIDQYGWTPERIWGVLAAGVAIAIGLAGWWAVARDRLGFAARWQRAHVHIGMVVCGIALFLALPIVDFGVISARDQFARLRNGTVSAEQFDWRAMAFDFGPAGRSVLTAMSRDQSQPELRRRAILALRAEDRFQLEPTREEPVDTAAVARHLTITPVNRPLPAAILAHVADSRLCAVQSCAARWLEDGRVLVIGRRSETAALDAVVYRPTTDGVWASDSLVGRGAGAFEPSPNGGAQPVAPIVLRPVERQQVVVGGQVLGEIPPAQ
jgi:hypothetical protein